MTWPWQRSQAEESPWTWPEAEVEPQIQATGTRFVGPGSLYDGSNFFDGVGGAVDEIAGLDYWTLRKRSSALFYGNLYARGIIHRMVTDIINTGLEPEATPDEEILGLPEDALSDWAENHEKRWRLYCESKEIVDFKGAREEGELQAQIYTEALICGDCLVVNRVHPGTDLPQIQIVNGDRIRTPAEFAMDEAVVDGVRIDKVSGKHLGYYVYDDTEVATWGLTEDNYRYISVVGAKSGRRNAWMVYGPLKREDGVRGEPLLGAAIQPLKEISDYRGSEQLKKKLNAMFVLAVERTGPVKTKLATGGAMNTAQVTGDSTGATPPVTLTKLAPGILAQSLEPGEKLVAHQQNSSGGEFGSFEAAIMIGVAWGLGIPPEILMMSFNKAFSASTAAKNKWNTYIGKERRRFSGAHCKNHHEEWFVSSVLSGRISAAGFINSLTNPGEFETRRAWLQTEWFGQVEPVVDIVKHVNGAKIAVGEGWSTNTREARGLNGSKFTANIKRVAKENLLKAEAMRPLLELQQKFGNKNVEALMDSDPELALAQIMGVEKRVITAALAAKRDSMEVKS